MLRSRRYEVHRASVRRGLHLLVALGVAGVNVAGGLACVARRNVEETANAPPPRADATPPWDATSSEDAGVADASAAEAGASDEEKSKSRAACKFTRGAMPRETLAAASTMGEAMPIEHIVVVMQENRSFDSYFARLAEYDKAHGARRVIASAPPNASNPAVPFGLGPVDGGAELHFAAHATEPCTLDTPHDWASAHQQYDDGRNDGFFFTGSAPPTDSPPHVPPSYRDGARALAWYDERDLPFYYALYSRFAISDAYFSDVMGPTFPNRMYLYSATSFGLTENYFPDLSGYPFPGKKPAIIFDELEDAGVSWAIYAENSPAAGVVLGADLSSRYPKDPQKSWQNFLDDAKNGTLPAVSFVDSDFEDQGPSDDDEHPPADVQVGQHFVWQVVNAVTSGPSWPTSALFLTYDENGGFYDHVPPPRACEPDDMAPQFTTPEDTAAGGKFDRYGFRVPFVVVSPYAKRAYVSHTTLSHASITRFIETKFALPALSRRDANADPLSDLFDWSDPPLLTPPTFEEPTIDAAALAVCTKALGGM